ncbi:PstS family phosphate ABC transporter substrate-binding protein [Umezakia ovalisporum]|jgi:phosphate transport system substrate-binding protein|uniref:Phosphate-binding protein n=2 Tax=Umezakia ovalisporum TaxID=75695 RepID=A0AA43KF42_9CYAN|nr:PstS family phosphate ABC transporter substrate-binding protein [Umezakia ovalisporum]MBI1243055.1 phosphate ABC transporter substrate-binding protein PstS family protein [Nostoc sp. RI_552]MDH6055669.1 PstS family phosphate ABC transporter substrate-binding protein [Umezakia ovalisporum FSS-43]MDH6063720.1 PstS family phosphate ABC transporter substrate-binding protein [Umezakia ovalisporum FSS-62]MDH6068210.1 PstS family phosphate ABC transporter substrate-binding protein [Umezakia ovalisp
MKATAKKLALTLGVLVVSIGCATSSNTSSETPQSVNVTEVSNSTKISQIKIDGSSTVYPITVAIAQAFQQTKQQNKAQITVNFSGTSTGFEKFCAGEIDISNASRPILKEEMAACDQNGIRYFELPIAFDALTVVINPQNNWAKDITVAELKKIWAPAAQGRITRWNQVRASWPDRPLTLYGAGDKSGTFDYFTEATVGTSRASRRDYTASEDDDVLVAGINKDPNALGYFGYAYYEQNKDKLKALPVDSGKGMVLPSRETVEKSQYQPLSRPLFIYANFQSAQNKPGLKDFLEFYFKNASQTAISVGYVPLPDEAYNLDYVNFNKGKVGTVFEGKSQLNMSIGELLRKQARF